MKLVDVVVAGAQRVVAAVRRHPVRWLAALPVAAVLFVVGLLPFTPSIGDIRKARLEQPAVVMSADRKELAVFRRSNREWVPLQQISPHVVKALIATEDHRFYQHRGIDFRRTASAVFHTLSGDRQGGSTITQQLARNLYPEEIGRSLTLTRKIKEALTALKIEAVHSKQDILETYLNTVPFLYNAYGIEMAARTYFDKSAGKLDLLESATLIGMLKGTSYYNPVLNPQRALQRRNTVLGQMVKHGQLEAARFDLLKTRPMKLDFERQDEQIGPAPHFAQHIKRWLIEWADRKGYDIHADGLVVRTTIDSRLQAAANQALTRQADRLQTAANTAYAPKGRWSRNRDLLQALVRESAPYRVARDAGASEDEAMGQVLGDAAFMEQLRQDKTRLQAGFLALDPRSGQVKAWVGSRDFRQDQFDHVQQARRQPGSTFKPFVYGAAFENGVSASDTFFDGAVEIRLPDGTVWRPTDSSAPSGRDMTLRDGLVYSKNTITAQVMQRVGPARVAQLARAAGVRQSKLDEVPSLGLGTSPVTLREMVAAYGTLANGGSYIEPVLVTRVENRAGALLEAFAPVPPEPVMTVSSAQLLVDVMRGVVDRGTGTAIRSRFGIAADVAGKTGTTQDNTDGWFILMHPQLVAGAWVGFNDARITMSDSWGQGAQSALPMVGEFFQQTLRSRAIDPQARFATPVEPVGLEPLIGRVGEWLSSVFGLPAPADASRRPTMPPPRATAPAPTRPPTVVRPPAEIDATWEPPPVVVVPSAPVAVPRAGFPQQNGPPVFRLPPGERTSDGLPPVVTLPPRSVAPQRP